MLNQPAPEHASESALLRLEDVSRVFDIRRGLFGDRRSLVAVDHVSLNLAKGASIGLVGESGCGKSTLGRLACGLLTPSAGQVLLDGRPLPPAGADSWAAGRIQMIFQDPFSSLNPRLSVGSAVAEPLAARGVSRAERRAQAEDMLATVGLGGMGNRYPHEFSGGQRQRIGIARALAVEPSLIIADEPVSALDVSIQAQVLNLLNELKHDLDLTYIFVAHDLSVVEYISDRVGVMYLGNFVEVGEKEKIYSNPMHPYTQALLSAVPVPDPTAKRERILLEGSIPSAHKPPTGCKFHTRCPKCMECCKTQAPERYEVDDGHYVYCHLYDKERREQQK